MVIGDFAGMRREAKVELFRQFNVTRLEALGPLILLTPDQVQLHVVVFVVGQLGLGRERL